MLMEMGVDEPIKLRVVAWQIPRNWEHIYILLGNWNTYIAFDPVIGQKQDNTDTLTNRDGGHFDGELKFKQRKDYFIHA